MSDLRAAFENALSGYPESKPEPLGACRSNTASGAADIANMAIGDNSFHLTGTNIVPTISVAGTTNIVPAPYSNSFGIYDGTTFGNPPKCLTGHIVTNEYTEYGEGYLIAFCDICSDKILIKRIPGGIPLLRIKALLGTVMGLDEETAQCEGFDISILLGEFADVRAMLESEEFSTRQARKLFDMATQILNTKVIDGLDKI